MNSEAIFRNLTSDEISSLMSYGCGCDDWSNVRVLDGFEPSVCRNVTFSGTITIGCMSGSFTDASGVSSAYGISNARIHNCAIGSKVLISNIGDYIANYRI